ncbi:response regulator transcription factor [Paenibacillus antri]|uniref:Response regulator transcription factor n=1 Tax=Paenibacillus antri TaxID=2582848 RepID=A0A5R9FY06_9BACL|nr:response regulator transcription factor [Paenibacillus antri]TLS48927.1 response regulator transcription factor [Paenibacillus antri]
MEIQLLVVEDDVHIREMVGKFLRREGYAVDTCSDGALALERLCNKKYHLVLLDILLPGMNGQELLKELRKTQDTPVLIMSALGDEDNQLAAFANEVDDYVVKPFSLPILVKRVETLLRRSGILKKEIRFGKLALYPESYGVTYAGEAIALTPKEFEILMLFVMNKERIVPRETLLTRIWGYDFDGNEGIVHASIKKLRDKLPEHLIKTVKGVGYRLEESAGEA